MERAWALEPGRLGADLYVSTRREAISFPSPAFLSWETGEDTCLVLWRVLARVDEFNMHAVGISVWFDFSKVRQKDLGCNSVGR